MDNGMDYLKVVAIIRTNQLQCIEQNLSRHGVKGITVSKVKGYGEYTNFFKGDWLTSHMKIEIYTMPENVEQIVSLLMDCAHTGLEGDGIIAVESVKSVFRIRTRAMMQIDEI